MTKNDRRRKPRLSPAQLVQPGIEMAGDEVAETIAETTESSETSLRDEYRYVLTDLKRIGILAIVMLATLIALAIVLT